MLDLKLLKTFVVVGDLLHFGRAAEALHSTQPGVTQHIARLEEQLGVQLLRRSKRAVSLTEAGTTLLRQASQMLALADRMHADAHAMADGLGGHLLIGLSSAIIHSTVPACIRAFRHAHPLIRISPTVERADRLYELLDASLVDVLVTTLPKRDDQLHNVKLRSRIEMGVALPSDHPLAKEPMLSIGDLADQPFYTVPRDRHPEVYDSLIAIIRRRGRPARIVGHEISFTNLLARVALGDGVALVPSAYAGIATPGVNVVPISDASLSTLQTYLVYRRDRGEVAVEKFIRAMRERDGASGPHQTRVINKRTLSKATK
ncbi:LysR family transcriptional regulator [Caballeronia novacaledonica]|uniref:LysR family transcriptional regulator n=1 Tax=Caballeronia novacaledonica TaxID=1544861 RepID=A0AA37IK91_9BURK|nr:LysR family transcriptional regulator [Caballeronia novacaledonica]GJH30264.1 LysR family transcriptional regulator [Caballeronia novacaledonica]